MQASAAQPRESGPAVRPLALARKDLIFSPSWDNPFLLGVKRGIDIVVSGIALVALSPLFLVLAVAVKWTSPGPIFYRWKVVGKNGQPFLGFKFRTMFENADDIKPQLETQNEMHGPVFKISKDPRVTKAGAWMRRHSLDELPQLYSVLKGEMSLVGPRPPLVTEYARFSDFQRQKLMVKPGITCLWQINGRNHVSDFDEWVKLDLEYIRKWSLTLDARILLKTIAVVFIGTGK